MSASLPGLFDLQTFTDAGAIAVNYRVYTYATGTTTFKAAYTDPAGTVQQTYVSDGLGGRYIATNARGELPSPLFLTTGAYDISLKRSDGTTVWTRYAIGTDDTAATIIASLTNTTDPTQGAGLLGFNGALNYAVGTIGYKEKLRVDVEDYGAVPDWNGSTGTDNTTAIQAAINAIGAVSRIGGEVNLHGRYKITAMLSVPFDGVVLVGHGSPRNRMAEVYNASTTGTHAIHFGDLAETSIDANHFNSQGIRNISVTGNASSGQGIRCYNTAIDMDSVWVFGHGQEGQWITKGWNSHFRRVYWQANALSQFKSITALNDVVFDHCGVLSKNTANGLDIGGGSAGSNSIVITNLDGEGMLNAIYFDTSTGGIKDVQINGGNFESNVGHAIAQAATGNITGLEMWGGVFYLAGNGVAFTNLYSAAIFGAAVTDVDFGVSNPSQCSFFNPRLEGAATVTGFSVVTAVSDAALPNGALVTNATARSPLRSKINGTYYAYEPLMPTGPVNVATVGAATAAINLVSTNCVDIQFTAAATGLTISTTGDASPYASSQLWSFVNGSTASGTITFPAAYKTTAAVPVPTSGKRTSVTFWKDGNGVWNEINRGVNAG